MQIQDFRLFGIILVYIFFKKERLFPPSVKRTCIIFHMKTLNFVIIFCCLRKRN